MVTPISHQKSSFSFPQAAIIAGAVGVCAWFGGIPSAVTALVTIGVSYCSQRNTLPLKKAHLQKGPVLPKVSRETQTVTPTISLRDVEADIGPKKQEGLLVPPSAVKSVVPKAVVMQKSRMPFGLKNTNAANCAFNSIIQYFEFDPRVAYMARHPISDTISMNDFVQFLMDQGLPDPLIKEFQNSYSEKDAILDSFLAFIRKNGMNKVFGMNFSGDTFLRILAIRKPYHQICEAYDQARKDEIGPVKVDSQILRNAMFQFMPTEFPKYEFVDAHAVGQFILDLVPAKQHLQVYEKYIHGDRVLGLPNPTIQSFIQLEIPKGEKSPNLQSMFNLYCNKKELVDDLDRIKGNNVIVDLKRRFSAAPAVHFHVKRFKYINGKRLKIDTPIAVPQEINIPIHPEGGKKYQIASFIVHFSNKGEADFGHYVACVTFNNQYYLANDSKISLISNEQWQAYLKIAYLICYTEVN